MTPLEYAIRSFQLHVTDEPAIEYKMTGPFELMVTMTDGRKYLYDEMKSSARYLPRDSQSLTDEEIKREFTIRFNDMMERRRMTQTELSKLTGIPQPQISKYINGQSLPGFIHLDRICKALQCSADDLRYV